MVMAAHPAVTQRDIARALGLTAMTVSRALSGSPLLAAATRERILAKASALGYRPNGMARRVHEGRYRGMALLGSTTRPSYNIAEQAFHLAIGATLAERSWHLTEGWLPAEGLNDATVIDGLLDRMLADAVVLHDVGPQSPQAEELLRRHHIPAIWANSGRAHDAVDFADAEGAEAGVRHLLAQGYRRPGLVLAHPPGPEFHVSTRERARGFTAACAAAGIPSRLLHPPTPVPFEFQIASLRQQFAGPERPDAVICYDLAFATLVRIIAAEHAWRIGPDLGVIIFGSAVRTVIDQAFTALDLDYASLGREAVQMAWRRIDSGRRQAQVLIPVVLTRPGQTTTRSG